MTTTTNSISIHIIGNGPSQSLFERDSFRDDFVVGCNFSDEKYSPEYTVITDITPIRLIVGNQVPPLKIPAVVSDRVDKYVKETLKGWNRVSQDKLILHDVFKRFPRDASISKNIPPNSAQNAVYYTAKKFEDRRKTIYLWGLDSFWTTDITSATDPIVNKRGSRIKPNVTRVWLKYWKKIFDRYKEVEFFIVCPDKKINNCEINSFNTCDNVKLKGVHSP